MKARIFAIAAALTLAIGIGVGSSGSAYAQNVTGDQFCFNNFCLNAWNGGPYVNEFTQGVANNYFTVISNQPATGYVNLEFTGSRSPYEFGCIGDFGNSQTDARAGLSPCGGGNVPWGGNFTATHCPGGLAFKNVHWNGWLAPASAGDGTPYYLNSASEACFVDIPTG